jgi:hypothetical protein
VGTDMVREYKSGTERKSGRMVILNGSLQEVHDGGKVMSWPSGTGLGGGP